MPTSLRAVLLLSCWCGASSFGLAAEPAEADRKLPQITIEELVDRLRSPAEVRFKQTPLPDVVQELIQRYGLPLVLDESVKNLPEVPLLTLSVTDINVRQLLDVIGSCTSTARWMDPPTYDRHTRLRILIVTRKRAKELADHTHWKTVAVHQSERVVAALAERTDIDFADTSLSDALDFFRGYHQIPVEYAGPKAREESPLTLKDQQSTLRAMLDRILTPLDLGYVAENGVLRIVPAKEARQTATTRVYAVPKWVGGDVTDEQLEAAFLRSLGDQAPDLRPSISWLKHAVMVTAAEPEHGRIEQFVQQLRSVEQMLAPLKDPPHAPGQLPAN